MPIRSLLALCPSVVRAAVSSRPLALTGGLAIAITVAATGCMPLQTAPPPASSGDHSIVTGAPTTTSAPPPPNGATDGGGATSHGGFGTSASPPPSRSGPADRHVYRLDFVLTTTDGNAAPVVTSFTLNLGEKDHGEVHVGKNVALTVSAPSGTAPGMVSPRQDVGLKVGANFQNVGDDLYFDVSFEMSAFDPPTTIRKVVERGNAVATVGKPSLIASLDEDHKHYQLTVTPTKLR